MNTYTVIIEKDEESDWLVGQCVELPAAMSQGKTRREVLDDMRSAIALVLEYEHDVAVAEAAVNAADIAEVRV